jgi:hypothetical protein
MTRRKHLSLAARPHYDSDVRIAISLTLNYDPAPATNNFKAVWNYQDFIEKGQPQFMMCSTIIVRRGVQYNGVLPSA